MPDRRTPDSTAAATDPACHLSPDHARFASYAEVESQQTPPPFLYRRMAGANM